MRAKTVQSSFLSGVLDPRASARVGTDAFANGLLVGRNVIPVHLGGVRRRPGMRYVDRLSNVLVPHTPTSATAPNGGTAANGYDDNEATLVTTTNNISTVNPYVVLNYDMGSVLHTRYVDIRHVSLSAGSSSEFALQTSGNGGIDWLTVSTFFVNTVPRSYRFSMAGTVGDFEQLYRIAKVTGTDLGTAKISVGEFNIWTESSTLSAVRLIPFELSTTQQYLVALTDRAGYIYQDGALLPGGYFPTPYGSADLAELDAVVGADSLFMVHENFAPRYLVRDLNGVLAFSDFQSDVVSFTAIPKYDFDDSSSPAPTSEVQVITFSAGWIAGDALQISLDGARSAAITYAGDATADQQLATATNIAREVQKLYVVPGDTGVTCARTGALAYTVTFAAGSAKPYGLMTVIPLVVNGTATATAAVTRTTSGVSREEPAWSATRGWPRTVTFFEGRLYFGGSRSLRQSLFGSFVNDITSFEISQGLDGDAILVTLDGQQTNVINGLYAGRAFQLFTSGGEFRYIKQPGFPITPSDAPKNQTQYGSAKIRPVGVDGSTIFVQRTKKAIRDFNYNYEEDAYASLGLSSLAPHLINAVADVAAWNGSSTDEISLVFVVNGDGTMAVLNTRREADVRAWTQWITGANAAVAADGVVSGHDRIKAAAAVIENIYFATARTIGSTDKLYLEIADENMRSDASVLKHYDLFGFGADYSVSFLSTDPLLGADSRVTVDGLVVSNITPVVGSNFVTMPASYLVDTSTDIRIGLNFDPMITPMPLSAQTQTGVSIIKKQRVVKIKVKVRNTVGLRIDNRPIPDRFYDTDNFDSPLTPYSGNITIEESSVWDERADKTFSLSQVDPLPMEILGTEVQLEVQD